MAATLKSILDKPKLSPQDRKTLRVAIAKDVLKVINPKKRVFQPIRGEYLTIHFDEGPAVVSSQDQISDLIKQPGANCTGCALGAMLFSYVRLFNDLTMGKASSFHLPRATRAVSFDANRDTLSRIFSLTELRKIEAAYEEWNPLTGLRGLARAKPSGASNETRLRRIMSKVARTGSFLTVEEK